MGLDPPHLPTIEVNAVALQGTDATVCPSRGFDFAWRVSWRDASRQKHSTSPGVLENAELLELLGCTGDWRSLFFNIFVGAVQ